MSLIGSNVLLRTLVFCGFLLFWMDVGVELFLGGLRDFWEGLSCSDPFYKFMTTGP